MLFKYQPGDRVKVIDDAQLTGIVICGYNFPSASFMPGPAYSIKLDVPRMDPELGQMKTLLVQEHRLVKITN